MTHTYQLESLRDRKTLGIILTAFTELKITFVQLVTTLERGQFYGMAFGMPRGIRQYMNMQQT